MIRALTEPFGHVLELRHLQERQSLEYGDQARITYCCSSSASLARLSLHGLMVGAMPVQASVSQLSPAVEPGHGAARDELASSLPVFCEPAYTSRAASELPDALPPAVSQLHLTPRMSGVASAHVAPSPAEEGYAYADDPRPAPWRAIEPSALPASDQGPQQSPFAPKVSLPSSPYQRRSLCKV